MSAWIVSKDTIDLLTTATARIATKAYEPELLERMGQDLWEENHRSVNYRYSENEPTPVYHREPVAELPPALDMTGWHWVTILKTAQCYEYQTCEHPEWGESLLRGIILAMQEAVEEKLTNLGWPKGSRYPGSQPDWLGMDKAAWGWNREDGFPGPDPEPEPRPPTVYIKATDVAKLLRADLKQHWPGTKFSVRTDRSGTLNVSWTDGPPTNLVDEVAKPYAGEGFDGMTDMRYSMGNGYLTDFVFTHRELSPEAQAALTAEIRESLRKDDGYEWDESHRYLPVIPQIIMRETGRCPEASMWSYVVMLSEHRAMKQYATDKEEEDA
jgi:hypothetical protein